MVYIIDVEDTDEHDPHELAPLRQVDITQANTVVSTTMLMCLGHISSEWNFEGMQHFRRKMKEEENKPHRQIPKRKLASIIKQNIQKLSTLSFDEPMMIEPRIKLAWFISRFTTFITLMGFEPYWKLITDWKELYKEQDGIQRSAKMISCDDVIFVLNSFLNLAAEP